MAVCARVFTRLINLDLEIRERAADTFVDDVKQMTKLPEFKSNEPKAVIN